MRWLGPSWTGKIETVRTSGPYYEEGRLDGVAWPFDATGPDAPGGRIVAHPWRQQSTSGGAEVAGPLRDGTLLIRHGHFADGYGPQSAGGALLTWEAHNRPASLTIATGTPTDNDGRIFSGGATSSVTHARSDVAARLAAGLVYDYVQTGQPVPYEDPKRVGQLLHRACFEVAGAWGTVVCRAPQWLMLLATDDAYHAIQGEVARGDAQGAAQWSAESRHHPAFGPPDGLWHLGSSCVLVYRTTLPGSVVFPPDGFSFARLDAAHPAIREGEVAVGMIAKPELMPGMTRLAVHLPAVPEEPAEPTDTPEDFRERRRRAAMRAQLTGAKS